MSAITHTEVRMYRMGTGDCFVLKFFAGTEARYTMMIDCGTWKGNSETLAPFIKDLKNYVGNHVDLLVVTHEHLDHVHGFHACRDLFENNFTVDRVWMGWTENDRLKKVKQWQKDYGDQKRALAVASGRLKTALDDPAYRAALSAEANGADVLGARRRIQDVLTGFAELHVDLAAGQYVGMLQGMKVVKETIGKNRIEYFRPGDVVENVDALPGIRFFVLGPPTKWEDAKVEGGGAGETYDHNKDLALGSAFAAAVLDGSCGDSSGGAVPFDGRYKDGSPTCPASVRYNEVANAWRRIDHEWLLSAGSLALRVNSITNNLSLALAIEFEESGRVMLFPGDAEYGSWASWHKIKWSVPSRQPGKHLTEDLLNRTVFYKVAHHLSHNGTAARLGLEMMKDPDLAAMATLDYDVISPTWKNTMPNRAILNDLLERTKGRLMIMREASLFTDKAKQVRFSDKLAEARTRMSAKKRQAFERDTVSNGLFIQYTVHARP